MPVVAVVVDTEVHRAMAALMVAMVLVTVDKVEEEVDKLKLPLLGLVPVELVVELLVKQDLLISIPPAVHQMLVVMVVMVDILLAVAVVLEQLPLVIILIKQERQWRIWYRCCKI